MRIAETISWESPSITGDPAAGAGGSRIETRVLRWRFEPAAARAGGRTSGIRSPDTMKQDIPL
jgi:hypothetical protein